MGKGYSSEYIKEKLVDLLQESKTGFSGVEISKKLDVNRITITKYLNIFAAEGLIRQKNIGNVILWFLEEGTEKLHFPDDYFKIKTKFLDYLIERSENQAYNLIRNCLHSNVNISKLMIEIIIPAIEEIENKYQEGKIGNAEKNLLNNFISNSIQILYQVTTKSNSKKNVILLATDPKSTLISESAAASFRSDDWIVSSLGDMSNAIDVLFDLDLEKLLLKVWKQKTGIMVIVIFSETEQGFKFFSEAVNSIKKEYGKNLHLILCGGIAKKTGSKADLVTENFESVIQWSQTIFESTNS